MPLTSSTETDKIDEALAKARGEYLPIEKGRTADAGKFSYDYADLADVFLATSAALSKHGLGVVQDAWCVWGENTPSVFVQTKLTHNGQWYLSSELELRVAPDGKMSTIQCIGSAETFARRYQTVAMLAVQPKGDDDDGHGAGGSDATTEPKKERPPLPECATCKTNSHVIIGKPEYGGGFVCYKGKGGCGAKWQAGQQTTPGTQLTTDQQRQALSGEGSQEQPPVDATKPKVNKVYEAVRTRLHEIGCQNANEANAVLRFVIGKEEHGGYRWATLEQVKADPGAPAAVILALGKAKEVGMPDSQILHDALDQAGMLEPAGASA